ncbi:MAG TPA: hypothetical protein ENJ15_05130 [Caldithrix abyssi]|uniref:Organic solvent tolerance-like N-terminal domain-containing protein n=1 Tax=Caldithrix abyssi TaxID=187145 RepID=A0A7V5RPI1_CALAY|nr:hypothetical protein [Caldithrix abyssi]
MRSLLLLLLAALLPAGAQKSGRIEIIHADVNQGRMLDGEQLRILSGNVHVRKDTLNLFCDRAVFYTRRDLVELSGHVFIDRGKRKLNSARLNYYPKKDMAFAFGGVRVSSAEDTLRAGRMRYDLARDTLYARYDVRYFNPQKNIRLFGETAYFNKNREYLHLYGNSRVVRADSAGGDTLRVWSEHLYYWQKPTRQLFARDSVRLEQGDFHARADSIRYDLDKELAYLMGRPRVKTGQNILNGDYMIAEMDSMEVKRLLVENNATALSPRDSLSEDRNRLSGREIELFLENKKPVLIIARYNAGSIYFVDAESESGSNYATADSIYVFFKQGKPDSIDVSGGVQGKYYPEDYKGVRKF